ncbi:L-Ala-D/L-amino acid epimerase isoform X1 [Senna tora]|uniref:L-Ala-D/L-amino acid epimerase isoform X1 n=1 Tax=Senna tora TaxID=362788 RepID=A0A834TDG0_9FABA|nr:L-Ala-D/L-amino acid epimerase isoform X1 [Senna tora]
MGVTPVLFEQPVHRDDWEGLGHVSHIAREKYGVSVAADESCRSLNDVSRIAEGNLADVINIKLAKVGVMGALDIIDVAKDAGLSLMIGGMVETRLAMGFAGHLAAGLGCFK